ncbi:hypothetical protein PtrSN002B_012160 [Pyrenophora tritici-repentis]|nr:hypothetical protein PtrSN002B_012160 [Pyrenophora tritici-repentis]
MRISRVPAPIGREKKSKRRSRVTEVEVWKPGAAPNHVAIAGADARSKANRQRRLLRAQEQARQQQYLPEDVERQIGLKMVPPPEQEREAWPRELRDAAILHARAGGNGNEQASSVPPHASALPVQEQCEALEGACSVSACSVSAARSCRETFDELVKTRIQLLEFRIAAHMYRCGTGRSGAEGQAGLSGIPTTGYDMESGE